MTKLRIVEAACHFQVYVLQRDKKHSQCPIVFLQWNQVVEKQERANSLLDWLTVFAAKTLPDGMFIARLI
jgi:hypothetical protein